MNLKRTLLSTVIVILASLSAISVNSKRPNIVYILADDMGHGDITALNKNCKYPTPNLDNLTNQGMAFTQAYSGSAICTPTRYGILTGRYCWRDGIGLAGNYAGRYIPEGQRTVASFLRDIGYETIIVGKWHLGTSWTLKDGTVIKNKVKNTDDTTIDFTAEFHGGPLDHGFDYWFGIGGSLDFAPYVYLENRKATMIPTDRMPTDKRHRFGHRAGLADPDLNPEDVLADLTEKAVSKIKNSKLDKPFFLYMPLNAPHSPVAPSAEWAGKSNLGADADFRMEVDWSVGEVMKALKEKGIADNTIVIFTADNGTSGTAYRELMGKGHDTSDGRRGHKASHFEGGHRVPFIVRWPNMVKAGQFNNGLITLEDFFATCSDILDVPLPLNAVDCVSFLPQLKGQALDESKRDVIISSLSHNLIIRKDHWKLICYPEHLAIGRLTGAKKEINKSKKTIFVSSDPWYKKVILYDLKNDVAETTNICKSNPKIVSWLAKYALESITSGRSNRGAKPTMKGKLANEDLLKELVALDKK